MTQNNLDSIFNKIIVKNRLTVVTFVFFFYMSGVFLIFRSNDSLFIKLANYIGIHHSSKLLRTIILMISTFFYYSSLYFLAVYLILRFIRLYNAGLVAIERILFFYNPIIFLFVLFFFQVLELTNYPNFVFSRYHINLDYLSSFVIYNLIFIFLYLPIIFPNYPEVKFLKTFINKVGKESIGKATLVIMVLLLACISLFLGFIGSAETIFRESINTISSLTQLDKTYDQLMYFKYSTTYRQLTFIKDHTTSQDMIIHPPQSDLWPVLSNQPFLRFFLYPRVLVSAEAIETFLNSNQNPNNFFILETRKGNSIWPIIDSKDKIIVLTLIDGRKNYYLKFNNFEVITGDDSISLIKVYK